jgi:hypothetical protein
LLQRIKVKCRHAGFRSVSEWQRLICQVGRCSHLDLNFNPCANQSPLDENDDDGIADGASTDEIKKAAGNQSLPTPTKVLAVWI